MRFSVKLVLICEAIFIALTVVISATIGTMAYEETRQGAIEGYIYEAGNILNNINLYLSEQNSFADSATGIVDIFSKDGLAIEVYDAKMHRLAANTEGLEKIKRPELKAALRNSGRQTFVLRRDSRGRYLAFFSQNLEREDESLLITVVKDISDLDVQRRATYVVAGQALVVGSIVVAVLIWLVTSFLTRPIRALNRASARIASGDYSERVPVSTQDEFGDLAQSFNIMAAAVEDNIAELEERNEAQSQMMDNLTHELRTPLTSIIGYADLLQRMPYDEATFTKGLGYIYSEGQRMLNLNKTLVDLTYTRHGAIVFETVDFLPIARDVCSLINLRAEEKGVSVFLCEAPLTMDVAPELMRSLLTNLLDNALKATPAGGRIALYAEAVGDRVNIVVRDTGKGMTTDQLSKITEPFYQVERSRNRSDDPFAGLGLGLAIVKQIVDKHHGSIRFESAPNQGTKVCVLLPRHQVPATKGENLPDDK